MRILFATCHPYIPEIAGGAQSSVNELVVACKARGHDVAVAAGLSGRGWLGMRNRLLLKLSTKTVVRDTFLGYSVYRAWFPWQSMDEIASAFKPDVVFLQSGFPVRLARECERLKIPVVIYVRNAERDDLGGDLKSLKDIRYIANSQFTANWLKESFDIDADVIYPLVKRSNYETKTDGKNITFINPHPLKGSALALDLAEQCPEIPFAFVEAWTLDASARQDLKRRLDKLPNVKLIPRTRNMAEIYRHARIVIAPSMWDEAFGRVVAEAHCSGIPVIASRRGGLPEALGPGGLLIDTVTDVSVWAAAVRKLWNDNAYHKTLSDAAYEYGRRQSMQSENQVSEVLAILSSARQRE